jgi:hypothetical protein
MPAHKNTSGIATQAQYPTIRAFHIVVSREIRNMVAVGIIGCGYVGNISFE